MRWFGEQHPLSVGAFVGASAFVEHVFPPYPGDAAVAAGAALGFDRRWPLAALYAAALAGSTVGTLVTFYFGRLLSAHGPLHAHPRVVRFKNVIHPIAETMEHRGLWTLVLARFVPVGRALVVVAAGYAGMHARRAIPAAILGAALWMGALFGVGALVGNHIDVLERVLRLYSRAIGAAVVLMLVAWGVVRWLRRRRDVAS